MNMRTKFTWEVEVASTTPMSNTKEPLWPWYTVQVSFWKDLLMERLKWLWYQIMIQEEISLILSKDGWQVKVSTFWKMLKKRSRKSIKKLDISTQNYFHLLFLFICSISLIAKKSIKVFAFLIYCTSKASLTIFIAFSSNMIFKFLSLWFRTKI